jgi:WD40 repeat protein
LDATSGEEIGSAKLDSVYGLESFTSDNRWLLIDGTIGVYILDITSGEVERCCGGGNGPGMGHRFSYDNRYLSYVGMDQTTGGPYHFVNVYDLETHSDIETQMDRLQATQYAADVPYQDQVWNQSYPVLSPRNYHTMTAPAISPDNRWLAAGYRDTHNDLLYIWDLQTGVIRFSIPHIAEINRVDFSPNGRYLASGGDDGVLRLFNPLTGKLDRTVTGFVDSITRLRFSADGSQITLSISDQPDQVYDPATGEIGPLATPKATLDPFLAAMHQQGYADSSSVLFSPDRRSLAIGGQSVQLWDLSSQSVTASLENPYGSLLGWAFSPKGDRMAGVTQNGEVLVWNASSGKLILDLTSQLLESGQVFYVAGARGGGIGMGIGSGVFTGQGIAFSPDGRQLAFGSGNAIEIWDIASASKSIDLVQPIAPAYATRVSYSADGKTLYAVINRNRDAQIWEVQTGKLLNQLNLPPVNPNAFSATALNGSLFARNNYDDNSHYWVELWDLETGEMLRLPTLARETEPLRFSPDGSLLIAISDKRLFFWETQRGRLVRWMPVDTSQLGLAISPDNATLAIGQDGKAQLWDISALRDAAAQGNFTPASPPPTSTPFGGAKNSTATPTPQAVTFSEPSTLSEDAISAANASQLRETALFGRGVLSEIMWASIPGDITFLTAGSQGVSTFVGSPFNESAFFPTAAWSESVAQLPNGEILAAGVISQSVQVWNLSTGTLLTELPGFNPVRLNKSGSMLVYSDDQSNLRVYDLAADLPVMTLYSMYESKLPVFSPDDRFIAAVNGSESRFGADHFVRIWDVQTGKIINAVGGPDAAITDLSFSADGRYIIGAAGGSAWIWDVRPEITKPYQLTLYTGEAKDNLMLYHRSVTSADISPDNRLLAIGDSERNIWLYEIANSGLVHRMQGHAAPINRLRFSPDGTRLLAADTDGMIILWNVASGAAIESLAAHTGPINGMIIGMDGNLRVWTANTVWTLQPADGALLDTTSIYSGTILTASPDGNWLATSSHLHMSVWDADTGEFGQQLEGTAGDPFVEHYWEGIILRGFYQAFFSPDGKQLTTKAPGESRIYNLNESNQFQLLEYLQEPYYLVLDEQAEPSSDSSDGLLNVRAAQRQARFPILVLSNNAGQEINRMPLSEDTWVTSLAFNPDARLIAVGQSGGSVMLVDVANWKIITTLTGHRGAVSALAFSSDGITLISAGTDGTIRFWSANK